MTDSVKKGSELGVVLIPRKCGRIRKVGIRSRHIFLIILLGAVSLLSFIDAAPRWAQYAYSYTIGADLLPISTRDSRDRAGFLSELSKLRAEREKVQILKDGLQARLDMLLALLESATPLAPTEIAKDLEGQEKGLGGMETEESEALELKKSLSKVAKSKMESSSLDQAFLADVDAYLEVLRIVPIGAPVEGGVNSSYGSRRSPFSGRWTHHTGVDISLPWGSEIRSTAEGVVKDVQRHPTYGLLVDISHGKRIVARFAHLSKAFLTVGDKVERGDLVGLVGSTGRSTGPHLHYEIRIDGKPINPEKLLRLAESMSL